MRCIGRKKGNYKRCKNNCNFLFCSSHKLQWWAIIVILATIGGLFQDVIKPLFGNTEAVSLRNERDSLNSIIKRQNETLDRQIVEFDRLKNEFEKVKNDIIDIFSDSQFEVVNRDDIFLEKDEDNVSAILQLNQKFHLGEYISFDNSLKLAGRKIEAFFIENSISSDFTIQITGTADRMRVTPNLRYRGEFGEIVKEPFYSINEKSFKSISLQRNQRLDNESLAFLRAYFIKKEFLNSIKITSAKIFIRIDLKNKMGSEFRECVLKIES